LKEIISFDIDDTISAYPNYFSKLSRDTYLSGGLVIINSSRSETEECRLETEKQLKEWDIRYDKLYLFRPFDEVEHLCPYPEFEWKQKYLWQKVHHCRLSGAQQHYDDDREVIELFKHFAPEIAVINALIIKN
jgi:hypothetical protein